MAPNQPARAISHAHAHTQQKDLPPSVETAYYRKCIDLKRRITDINDSNDNTRARIIRLNRGVQKMRLERAFLLEQLNKHMEYNIDDSDRSSSPPPTPTDKPLRSKRVGTSGGRKGTPPPLGEAGMGGGMGQQHHMGVLMSSAQSTPDPNRIASTSYFNVAPPTQQSPHNSNVNGTSVLNLPPLHALPPLGPLTRGPMEPHRPYYDPTSYDEQRPVEDGPGSSRAYSGAQQPPVAPQNGDRDTEMGEAGFTAVNRQG